MKIEFAITRSDSKAAIYAIDKFQPKLSWIATFNFFSSMLWGFLITIGFIVVIKGTPAVFRNQPGFIFGLGAFLIGLCIFFLQRYVAKRVSFSRAGIYGSTITYEIMDEKIVSWRNGNIKVEILPPAISDVVEFRGFILIFVAKTQAYYIPLAAFKTDKEKNEFLEALKSITKENC